MKIPRPRLGRRGESRKDALPEAHTERLPESMLDQPERRVQPSSYRPVPYRPAPHRQRGRTAPGGKQRSQSRDEPRSAGRVGPPVGPGSDALAQPPSIGRVSSAWQQHLVSAEWPRASLVADCGLVGPMMVTAASVVGRTHTHRGQQRQDAYGFKLLSGVLVCAVADGVSGAQLSAPAADVAVAAALTSASAPGIGMPPDSFDRLELAANDARHAVEELARRLLPRDLDAGQQCASTLVLATARVIDKRGDMEVRIVSVGDSSALELTREGAVEVILGPEAAERSQELRDYLPKRASKVAMRECVVPGGSTLLLATDGLAQDLRESPAVRDWVVGQLRDATTPVAAAHVLSYARQRSSDDLTFVAVGPALPE